MKWQVFICSFTPLVLKYFWTAAEQERGYYEVDTAPRWHFLGFRHMVALYALPDVLVIELFWLMPRCWPKAVASAHSVMMNNKHAAERGQTATSRTLAFMGHFWNAIENLRDISRSEGVSLLFFFPLLFFLPMQNSQKIPLHKVWAEEVWFECQVSCVKAKASWWACKPHHLSLLQPTVYHHLAHSWKLLRSAGVLSSLFLPSLKASKSLLSQLCCCLHVSLGRSLISPLSS